jgi:hypothetical protein
MTKSLPSIRAIIADVPEIKQFSGRFVYNFFEPDERSNDSGTTAPQFVQKRPSESFDSKFIDSNKFNRFTSRYIKLEWKPYTEQRAFAPVGLKISDNLSKIYAQQDFAVEAFVPLYIQDTDISKKLNFAVKKLVEQQRNLNKDSVLTKESPMDISKEAIKRLSDQISNSLIKESLTKIDEEGFDFFKNGQKVTQDELLEDVSNVKQSLQINTRFADLIVQTGQESSFNVFENEETALLDTISILQETANISKNPNILDSKDYDFEILEYLDVKQIDTNGFEPRWQVIGYIIDKTEILPNGNKVKHSPIIIENPNINTTVDYKIKYDSKYQYSIRCVAYLETQAEDVDTNDILVASYLISSEDSPFSVVTCNENVPPPWPADVNARWDYAKHQLILSWNFPPNPQRDIKQWQIFRRSNVDEGFELQKVYNFDDSTIVDDSEFSEFPDNESVEYMANPKCFWVDKEFSRDSKFIYAVCSVDAHGFSSNYSIQMEISFDKYNNRLIKKMISPSGAPKAYPNISLLADAFVDTIRDSYHSKVHVYFNPEYLKVTNSRGNDLDLLKTDKDFSYVLSLINIDLQEQSNIEIKLLDKRPTLDKNIKQANDILPTPKRFKIK